MTEKETNISENKQANKQTTVYKISKRDTARDIGGKCGVNSVTEKVLVTLTRGF